MKIKGFYLIFLVILISLQNSFSQNNLKITKPEKAIQYKGRPFFPIGFYFYPDDMNNKDDKELDLLIEAGFNVIHIDIKDSSNYIPYFNQCYAKGMKIIAQFGHDFGKFSMGDVGFLAQYKNHQALLGWSIADDANNGKYNLDTIAYRQKEVKRQKPSLPTFLSVYKNHEKGISKSPEELLPFPDVLAYEMYTIDNWGQAMGAFSKEQELIQAEKELDIFQKANLEKYNKILVAIPQTFSWASYSSNKTAKLPSRIELRNITYTGIMNGAKGVLNYCFGQKAILDKNITEFKLPSSDSLWQEAKLIAFEMNSLQNVLLKDQRTKIEIKQNQWLKITRWDMNNKTYLIISNLNKYENQELDQSIVLKGKISNLFPNRNMTLQYKNRKLKGNIAPGEVQIVCFQ